MFIRDNSEYTITSIISNIFLQRQKLYGKLLRCKCIFSVRKMTSPGQKKGELFIRCTIRWSLKAKFWYILRKFFSSKFFWPKMDLKKNWTRWVDFKSRYKALLILVFKVWRSIYRQRSNFRTISVSQKVRRVYKLKFELHKFVSCWHYSIFLIFESKSKFGSSRLSGFPPCNF